jgi:uncharacterized protein YdaU (DUF1376 family)
VNHYPRHIGDWMRDTAHLSEVEECIYSRCVDQYYSREAPLPADKAAVCRLVRASTAQARKAVGVVLDEFFKLEADGWHQKRCDQELSRYSEKSAKAVKSASARWGNSQSERNANAQPNAMRTHSEGNASQKPEANSQQTALSTVVVKEGAIELATALRAAGVNCSAMHPSIQELAKDRVSTQTALEALRIAKQDRGKDKPSIGYLMPIIKDMREGGGNWPHPKPSATMASIMKLENMKS